MVLIVLFGLFLSIFTGASIHEAVTMRRFPEETIHFPIAGFVLLLLCILSGAI
jgi:hypothetical protein